MNKTQRHILKIFAVAFFFFSICWVPCKITLPIRLDSSLYRFFYHYAPIWSQKSEFADGEVGVDTERLIIELITLTVICGVAFILANKPKMERNEKDNAKPSCEH